MKSSEEALNNALDKLVMVCPNKKTYDELTSLMFQLYCGNDFGLGNFSLSFLEKIEDRWRSGRKLAAKAKGIKLVVKNAQPRCHIYIHIFSRIVVMQMDTTQKRLIKQSKILMQVMSGEDRMYYLERMWDLYIDVYIRAPIKGRKRKRKNTPMDEKKAYELCSELTKIFGH